MSYSKNPKKILDQKNLNFRGGSLALLVGVCIATVAFDRSAVAREVVDVTGTRVVLSDAPKRIVTLAPSLGELAAEVLGDDLGRVVGASEYTDYPPSLKKLPTVGSYARFNLESVIALKPDLVLATQDGNSKDQVLHLREMGVPVVVVATTTLSQIMDSVRLVATAIGLPARGQQLVSQLRKGIEHLRTRAKERERTGVPVRVLLQIGSDPLVVVGRNSFLHETLEIVGAGNVYADAAAHYPRPSVEDVLHRNPDVILVLALGHNPATFKQIATGWTRFSGLKAVKNKKVRVVYSDAVLRPSLRMLEGLSTLERMIYDES